MKRVLFNLCLIFSFLLSVSSAYADDTRILETVDRYTQALKSGDVQEIKKLVGGSLYKKRRALLEENTEYPDWLMRKYDGASFFLPSGVTSSDQYPGQIVKVEILLESGELITTHLVLSPTDSGNWIIVDQYR